MTLGSVPPFEVRIRPGENKGQWTAEGWRGGEMKYARAWLYARMWMWDEATKAKGRATR